jgi:hypothetical protein
MDSSNTPNYEPDTRPSPAHTPAPESSHDGAGITFYTLDSDHLPDPLVADRELYADDARKILLEAGEAGAGWLVAAYAGSLIPGEWVRDLDLEVSEDGKVQQKQQAKPAAKQKAPAKDKQAKPAATKSK